MAKDIIFDTEKILNRPAMVTISKTSGLAGIAYWMNAHYALKGERALTKKDPLVIRVKELIDAMYADGRTTLMGEEEILAVIADALKEFDTEYDL